MMPNEKYNLFYNYFASISSVVVDGALPQLPAFTFKTQSRIDIAQTTETEIAKLLYLLNPHKSTGPDDNGK